MEVIYIPAMIMTLNLSVKEMHIELLLPKSSIAANKSAFLCCSNPIKWCNFLVVSKIIKYDIL